MKRTAAIAVIALGLLGACSTNSDPAETSDSSPVATDSREYTLADGTKVEFDRVGEVPAEMTQDIQNRFDKVFIEPDVEAYSAALATEEGAGPDVDNFLAFKNTATEIGAETGKYLGGVIKAINTCDEQDVVMWGFAAQTSSTMMFPECGVEDSKAAAQEISKSFLEGALGGADAWVVVEQNSAN